MQKGLMWVNVYGREAQKWPKNTKKIASFPSKSVQIYTVEWMFSLVSRKFLAMRNITLYSVDALYT